MQQHYQVINLHNIIRSQQSKIQELREELRIVNERQQNRYGQFVANNKISLQEKEKMIQFLKQELEKSQKTVSNGVNDISQRFERDKDKLEKQVISQKRKCLELQAKLKRNQNQYELHIQTMNQQLKKQNQQLRKYNESKTNLTMQITKLNNFYKSSIFQIGKRKETLLWVDKFTEYLENSELKQKRTLDDVSSFVKNQVNSLKNTLVDLVGEIGKNQADLHAQKNNVHAELIKVSNKVKQQCHKVLEENEQFWGHIIKQQKQSQKSEEIKALNLQLEKQQEKHHLEIEELKNKIKMSESQKKTIILGFQQLRSLTEQKQANYRQEIRHLKKNIEQLIESGTKRDQQFDKQIKTLTNQIENISERYYQNIENPARKISIKVSQDMEQVRQELNKIQANQSIKISIENLEKMIQLYGRNNTSSKAHQISQHLLSSNHIMEELIQACTFREREGQNSKTFTSRGNTFEREFEEAVEEELIVLREKYNKSQYEAILAKKHLAKLKEYCENIQKKNEPAPVPTLTTAKKTDKTQKIQQKIEPKVDKTSAMTQKIMQLQVENQALKQNIDHILKQHRQQFQHLSKKIQLKSNSEQLIMTKNAAIKQSIFKINQIHKKIEDYVNKQTQSFKEIKDNVKFLKTLILKPLESLELLNSYINDIGRGATNLQVHTELKNSDTVTDRVESGGLTHRSYHSSFAGPDQVKNYKEILLRRTQIYNSTNKLFTDLIRTLRESNISSKDLKQKTARKQEEPLQKRPDLRLKNIEKRLKDLQTNKLKSYNQLVQILSRIEQTQQKLQTKINKSITLKTTLNKFEGNLDMKINQIVNKTQIKLDKGQILLLKDEVIGDLRAKLQDSVHENEGLRKQMSILYMEKKL